MRPVPVGQPPSLFAVAVALRRTSVDAGCTHARTHDIGVAEITLSRIATGDSVLASGIP